MEKFEYVSESSIDPELICTICKSPYQDPRCTPCDHTFCADCINTWVKANSRSCPTCRQTFPINDLAPANRIVRNMLDRLLVKCTRCGDMTIRRDQFADHRVKNCPKNSVCCLAAEVYCPWTGTQDQLDSHLSSCVFYQLQDVLEELISENSGLKKQLAEQKIRLDDLENEIEELQNNDSSEETDERRTSHYYQLLTWLSQCEARSIFSLSQIPLSDDDVAVVVEEVMVKKQCTELELRDDRLTSEGVGLIAEALRCNFTLIKLDLRANNLSDQSITLLMDVLAVERSNLEWLNLSDNRITDTGARAVAEMLEINDKLTHLWLETNWINDRGVEAIALTLEKYNRTLQQLSLSGNRYLSDESVPALIRMVKANRSLTQLELIDCGLSKGGRWQLNCLRKQENIQLKVYRSFNQHKSIQFLIHSIVTNSSWAN